MSKNDEFEKNLAEHRLYNLRMFSEKTGLGQRAISQAIREGRVSSYRRYGVMLLFDESSVIIPKEEHSSIYMNEAKEAVESFPERLQRLTEKEQDVVRSVAFGNHIADIARYRKLTRQRVSVIYKTAMEKIHAG